jgi:hypothetical protein
VNLQFGPWQMLAGAGGNRLAIAGERVAAADAASLVAWRDGREAGLHQARRRIVGWPRIVGERVCWGDGVLDLQTGGWSVAAGVDALFEPPSPQGHEAATAWAWSADGRWLGCCLAGGRADPAARFVLLDAARGTARTLWRSTDVAPQAAWIGGSQLVLGSRQPPWLAFDGTPLGPLATAAHALPASRLEAAADESRLLAVCPDALRVWVLPQTAPLLDHAGDWIDGTLAPDGRALFALDAAGQLHAGLAQADAKLRAVADAPARIGALACDGRHLLVAAGPRQRWHRAAYGVVG